MDDDLEILTLMDLIGEEKTGFAHTKAIWDWLSGRIHDQTIMDEVHKLIDQATADLAAQNRQHWVGGFSIAKRYRCTLISGEYVPVLYRFVYLLHSPLKKGFTSEEFDASFVNSVEYSCYLRPDETESSFTEYIQAIQAN